MGACDEIAPQFDSLDAGRQCAGDSARTFLFGFRVRRCAETGSSAGLRVWVARQHLDIGTIFGDQSPDLRPDLQNRADIGFGSQRIVSDCKFEAEQRNRGPRHLLIWEAFSHLCKLPRRLSMSSVRHLAQVRRTLQMRPRPDMQLSRQPFFRSISRGTVPAYPTLFHFHRTPTLLPMPPCRPRLRRPRPVRPASISLRRSISSSILQVRQGYSRRSSSSVRHFRV